MNARTGTRDIHSVALGCMAATLMTACVVQSPGAYGSVRYQWAQNDHCWGQAWWQIQARGDDETRYMTPDGERQARVDYEGCMQTTEPPAMEVNTRAAVEKARLRPAREPAREHGDVTLSGSDRISPGEGRRLYAEYERRPPQVMSEDSRAYAQPKQDLWRPSPKYVIKPDPVQVDDPTTTPTDARAEAKARAEERRDRIRSRRACDAGDVDACTTYLDNIEDDPAFKAERDGRLLVGSIGAELTACVSASSGQLVVDQVCVVDAQARACSDVTEYSRAHGAGSLAAVRSSTYFRKLRAPFGRLVAQTLTKCR